MLKCQVCGYENRDDAQFCLNCGSPIEHKKLSEAIDDVSEERTVMLDPAAMQQRLAAEMREAKAAAPPSPPPPPPPPPVAAAPAPAPPRPPATPATPPPVAAEPALAPAGAPAATPAGEREWLVTLLLCIFLGTLGAHRFYTGKILSGVLQLVTAGGCFIWWLIDLFMILTGSFRDAEGRPLVKK